MKLTKTVLDKLKPPIDKAQEFHRDGLLKGFGVRITKSGAKSFIIEKLVNGKVRRITIGRYGELTAEQARKEAQKLLGKIATGIDPIAEKQSAKVNSVTLQEAFDDYLKARKELKRKTLYDYKNVMRVAFADWHNKALLSITKDKIAQRHNMLGEQRGKAYANLAMRLLRALYNFAAGQYEDVKGNSLIAENPVKRLSQTRAWYRIKRRETFIKAHDMPAWYGEITKLTNETLRDYLRFILFTGLRRQEAAKIKWSDIDFKAKTLTITDTKNHQQHTLPLSDYLYELLNQRRTKAVNDYVFNGSGKYGYIVEPRVQMAKITKATGINFTVHDLRRTFITTAESLDISVYALKKLLNHKMSSDVTAGYVVIDVERLRKPMQMITDYLLKSMNVSNNGGTHD